MLPDFSKRAVDLREELENPESDPGKQFNTYRQFGTLNPLLSRWGYLYRRSIRPVLKESPAECSLLDIGFGGGDVPLLLSRWARADGIRLQVTAIDRNPQALEFVRKNRQASEIEFLCGSVAGLLKEGRKFDVVISNHILHELDECELRGFLADADALSSRLTLFNDIKRSAVGYCLFALSMRPFFWNSYVVDDGLISIRRSYTLAELKSVVPAGWEVRPLCPFRLLAIREKHS
jgi:2-polyprenyl-3-methyl-5-hydroxy-6-metoxy-1,4-benzoquinol methylase